MPRPSIWTKEHIDFLESLVRQNLNSQDMATRMSRQFHVRVTVPQVNTLIVRMRTPSDPHYRDLPYRRRGARFNGY